MEGHVPVRRIRPSRRSRTGVYPSLKSGNQKFESELEEHDFLLHDFEPWVIRVEEQPLKIGSLTPDTRIITSSHGILVSDIAYEADLVKDWDKSLQELERKYDYCNKHGLIYGLTTDTMISRNRVTALSLVHQESRFTSNVFQDDKAVNARSDATEDSKADIRIEICVIRDIIAKRGRLSIASTLSEASRAGIACNAEDIFHAIASGDVYLADTPSRDYSSWILDSPSSTRAQSIKFFMKYEQFLERIRAHPDMHRKEGSPIVAFKER